MPDENDIVYTTYGLDLERIIRFFYELFGGSDVSFESFASAAMRFWEVFSIISFALSALLLFGFIYAAVRYDQLKKEEAEYLAEEERTYKHVHGSSTKSSRWQEVEGHISSDDPKDWRLAIIEADIMLEELLDSLGYVGVSIGDKLKTANVESFKTVQDAWDAHKVRNEIAHRGSDFVLTRRIATEAIAAFRRVFEEFKVI